MATRYDIALKKPAEADTSKVDASWAAVAPLVQGQSIPGLFGHRVKPNEVMTAELFNNILSRLDQIEADNLDQNWVYCHPQVIEILKNTVREELTGCSYQQFSSPSYSSASLIGMLLEKIQNEGISVLQQRVADLERKLEGK